MNNYRQMHADSLKKARPQDYQELKDRGELKSYLDEVEKESEEMFKTIVERGRETHPYNPVEWKNDRAAWEGFLKRVAREMVLNDLVLVRSPEDELADREGYVD